MAVSFAAVGNKISGATMPGPLGTTVSIGSLIDGYVLFHLACYDAGVSVTGVTFDGQAMTRHDYFVVGTAEKLYTYGLKLGNKPSGTYNVAVSVMPGSLHYVMANATVYQGVHQTASVGSVIRDNGIGFVPAIDIESVTGELVVGVCSADGTLAAGTNQTARWIYGGAEGAIVVSDEPGGADVTHGYTQVGGAVGWLISVIALKPAAAAVVPPSPSGPAPVQSRYLKNKGPLLVDKLRGYFDRLPEWLRDRITVRVEKQKVDAQVTELDPDALESKLTQEITDEKLLSNSYLGEGKVGSGNDTSGLPASNLSEIVLTGTGQVADVTETISQTESHLVEGPPLQDGSSEQVGDLWVKKEVTAPTFDKKVFQLQKDDLMPQEFRAAIPEKTESHVTDGTATLPTLSAIELLRKEEQVKVGVKETTVQSRDTTGVTPTLIGQRIDSEFNGATLNLEKGIVPDATTIVQPFGMTDAKILPYDDTKAVKETWTTDAAGFPTLVQYNYDAEMDAQVRTMVSIVPHGTALAPYGLEYSERKIDAKHKLRIVSDTPDGVPTTVTYETRNFTFPALLLNLQFILVALATPGRSEVQWTAGTRASFTVPTRFQTNTTYSGSAIAPNPVITWAPGDITFKGVSYSIGLSNILYNTWSNIGVSFSADAYYGNIVDRFSVSSTYPSSSQYISWIGTLQRISSTVSRYKRYWVLKDTYITIQ